MTVGCLAFDLGGAFAILCLSLGGMPLLGAEEQRIYTKRFDQHDRILNPSVTRTTNVN